MRHDFYKILSNVSVRFHKIFMRNPWQNARDFLQKSERWLSQSLNLWIPLNLLKWYDAKRTGLNSCPPLQQEVLQWNNLSWCLKFWLSCQKHPTWIFSGSKFASRLFNTKYKRYFSSKKKKTHNEKTVRAALITDTVLNRTKPGFMAWCWLSSALSKIRTTVLANLANWPQASNSHDTPPVERVLTQPRPFRLAKKES